MLAIVVDQPASHAGGLDQVQADRAVPEGDVHAILVLVEENGAAVERPVLPVPRVLLVAHDLIQRVGHLGRHTARDATHGHIGQEVGHVMGVLPVIAVTVQVPGFRVAQREIRVVAVRGDGAARIPRRAGIVLVVRRIREAVAHGDGWMVAHQEHVADAPGPEGFTEEVADPLREIDTRLACDLGIGHLDDARVVSERCLPVQEVGGEDDALAAAARDDDVVVAFVPVPGLLAHGSIERLQLVEVLEEAGGFSVGRSIPHELGQPGLLRAAGNRQAVLDLHLDELVLDEQAREWVIAEGRVGDGHVGVLAQAARACDPDGLLGVAIVP